MNNNYKHFYNYKYFSIITFYKKNNNSEAL